MMKMLSDPSGINKMMKAVQGLTKGMGGGGGPLLDKTTKQAQILRQLTVKANPVAPKFKTRF